MKKIVMLMCCIGLMASIISGCRNENKTTSHIDMTENDKHLIENISKSDIIGIWEETNPVDELFTGYLFFSSDGEIYYQASKTKVDVESFKQNDEYLIANSYELNSGQGNFQSSIDGRESIFTVSQISDKVILEMDYASAIGNYYQLVSAYDINFAENEYPNINFNELKQKLKDNLYSNIITQEWIYFQECDVLPKPDSCVKGLSLISSDENMYIYSADESTITIKDALLAYTTILSAVCDVELEERDSGNGVYNIQYKTETIAICGFVNDKSFGKGLVVAPFENVDIYKRRKISAQYYLFLTRRLSGLLCNIQSLNI